MKSKTKKEAYNNNGLIFGIDVSVESAVQRVIDAYRFSQSIGLGKLWVCFSGGKDSVAVYGVCKLASERLNVALLDMCEFHYNVTGIDHPELIYFMHSNFNFVINDKYEKSIWVLMKENLFPPTSIMRYCCRELKEKGGLGRFCLTGVRWAESNKRALNRGPFEADGKILNNDNDEDRRQLEHCIPKRKYICNPIIDWSEDIVWYFIAKYDLPYCKLYDEGYSRLGCIGCPMDTKRDKVLDSYPLLKNSILGLSIGLLTKEKKLIRNVLGTMGKNYTIGGYRNEIGDE